MAESTIVLFKTEAIAKNNPFHDGPFKTIEDVEYGRNGPTGSTPAASTVSAHYLDSCRSVEQSARRWWQQA
ncbi:hypothetical protein [Prescottella equi]|uniref:hypothetical protein n=1 Tax=Rhodococcus hoagii TaxID=43767 RepID=UPI0007CD49EE|nr:hypothetical protein [Prescottella equi]